MTITTWGPELDGDLEGIRYLLEQGNISGDQAAEMIRRAHARSQAITNSPGPAPVSPAAAGPGDRGVVPPVPVERLRQLSPEECWQALLFLAGSVPAAVETALAAVLTPLSTAGLAVR